MNYCPHCGKQVQEGTKFCSNCGQELSQHSEASQIARIQDELKEARANYTWSQVGCGLGFGMAIGSIVWNMILGDDPIGFWLLVIGLPLGIGFLIPCIYYDRKVKKLRKKL